MRSPIVGITKIGDLAIKDFKYQRTPLDWTPASLSDYSTAVVSWYDASYANSIVLVGGSYPNSVSRWTSRGPNANDYMYCTNAGDTPMGNTSNMATYSNNVVNSRPAIYVSGFPSGSPAINTLMQSKAGTGFSVMPSLNMTLVCHGTVDFSVGGYADGVPTRIPVWCGWGNANSTNRTSNTYMFGRYINHPINSSATYSDTTTNRDACFWLQTNSISNMVRLDIVTPAGRWSSNTTAASVVYSANSTMNYFSVNGYATGLVANNTYTIANTGPLTIGGDALLGPSNSRVMPGWFQEILVFNRMLTTAEAQSVEGYLAWKWGTQSLLVSGHPYANSKPLILGA